ncbi:MAG: DUF2807 domain-containing protein [Archangiaceae bacterium]|nr:DUF2807 domain-containing protein [Archangiaceae bacterium]
MRPLTLASLVFFSCGGIVGSGNPVTQAREVEPFRRLVVASGIELTGTVGGRAVSLKADDNVIGLVETVVTADTLTLRVRPDTWLAAHTRIIATVANDAFEGVEASGGSSVRLAMTPISALPVSASGGSDVELTGVSSGSFEVQASGGSSITLTGAAMSGTAAASGGSDLHLRGVCLDSLELEASGGSNIDARVATALTGSASGGSTVTIVGTPSNQVEKSGGSEVSLGVR